eukprot:NODE_6_length_70510_cov_1.054395.p5 type:complete len:664 gc:universal NODE_6_length_70510_cov_1.054395:49136-47145(-)
MISDNFFYNFSNSWQRVTSFSEYIHHLNNLILKFIISHIASYSFVRKLMENPPSVNSNTQIISDITFESSDLKKYIDYVHQEDKHPAIITFIENANYEELFEFDSDGSVTNSLIHWICFHNQSKLLDVFLKRKHAIIEPIQMYPILNIFLLKSGVLNATPLHWACRQGAIDIVLHLLTWIDQNCEFDDQKTVIYTLFSCMDEQGFSPFTCAVLSKEDFISFSILTGCDRFELLEKPDTDGHTVFHWMGYHGIYNMILPFADQNQIDLIKLLTKPDNEGFTPLHWAACKGHYYSTLLPFLNILKKSLSYDEISVELYKKNNENYSVFDYARMHDKTLWIYRQIKPKSKLWSLLFSTLTLSTVTFGILFPWYVYIIVLPISVFMSIQSIQYLYAGERNSTIVQQGLYLSGLVLNSGAIGLILFLTMYNDIHQHTFLIVFFISSLIIMYYNFFKTWNEVPKMPRLIDELHLRNLVVTLYSKDMLNRDNICTACVARKALRSKHCRELGICVPKFDHFCPWTSSVIGHHNHKYFYLFVTALLTTCISYILLSLAYLYDTADNENEELLSCTNKDRSPLLISICNGGLFHPVYFAFCIWILMNMLWSIFVWGSHTFLILCNMTTNEHINRGRFFYMNHVNVEMKKEDSDIELLEPKHPRTYLQNGYIP